MATDPTSEFPRYYEFLGEQLRAGMPLTPEMGLELWRAEHPLEGNEDDLVEFLREAVDDYKAGVPGIPVEEVFARIREKYGLNPERSNGDRG